MTRHSLHPKGGNAALTLFLEGLQAFASVIEAHLRSLVEIAGEVVSPEVV